MIYFIVLLLVLYPVISYRKNLASEHNSYYWFLCVVLIFLMGLRYRVGGDCIRYEIGFDSYPTLDEYFQNFVFYQRYQPFWYILCGFFKGIVDDYFFFQFFQCAFVNFVVFYFVHKHCCNKFVFVALFYCFEYFYFSSEIMRESIAVCLFLLAYDSLVEKSYVKYYGLASIAFLFHTSAVILFIMPFLYYLVAEKTGIARLVYIAVILFVVSIGSDFVQSFFSNTLFIGSESLLEETTKTIEKGGLNLNGIIVKLFFSFSIISSYFVLERSELDNNSNRFIVTMSLLLLFISFIYNPLGRFRNYFEILFLCLFADLFLISVGSSFNRLRFGLITMIISEVISFGTPVQHDYYKFERYKMYYPYSSVIDKTDNAQRFEVMSTQFLH